MHNSSPSHPHAQGATMARLMNHGRMKTPALVILVAGLFIVLTGLFSCLNRATADNQDDAGAKKAFAEAAEVLFHPRCLNCHPAGDAPLIGNDSAAPPVQRQTRTRGQGGRTHELHALPPGDKPGRGASRSAQLAHAAGKHAHGLPGPHARGVVPPAEGPEA